MPTTIGEAFAALGLKIDEVCDYAVVHIPTRKSKPIHDAARGCADRSIADFSGDLYAAIGATYRRAIRRT